MAKQLVDVGFLPDDGTGDPLRNAFIKINDNFNELYAYNSTINLGDLNVSGTPSSGTYLRGDGTWSAVHIPVNNITSTGTPSNLTYLRGDGTWSPMYVPISNITASGTPSNSTYLRGDGVWTAITGVGTVTSINGAGSVAGLTLSGTVTTSGSLTLSGTLSVTIANINVAGTPSSITFLRGDGRWATTGTVTSVTGTGSVAGLTLTGSVQTDGELTLGGTLSVPISSIDATGTPSSSTYLRGDGTWASYSSGVVTSVSGTGTVSGLTLSGTVTSSGSLTLGGTLSVLVDNISATGTKGSDTFLRGDGTWSVVGQSDSATTATGIATQFVEGTGINLTPVTKYITYTPFTTSSIRVVDTSGQFDISDVLCFQSFTVGDVIQIDGYRVIVGNNAYPDISNAYTISTDIGYYGSIVDHYPGKQYKISAIHVNNVSYQTAQMNQNPGSFVITLSNYDDTQIVTSTGTSTVHEGYVYYRDASAIPGYVLDGWTFKKVITTISTYAGPDVGIPAVEISTGGGGVVTSVTGTGEVAGITLSGTVTSSGELTLGGTLAVPILNIDATGSPTNQTFLRGDGTWSSIDSQTGSLFVAGLRVPSSITEVTDNWYVTLNSIGELSVPRQITWGVNSATGVRPLPATGTDTYVDEEISDLLVNFSYRGNSSIHTFQDQMYNSWETSTEVDIIDGQTTSHNYVQLRTEILDDSSGPTVTLDPSFVIRVQNELLYPAIVTSEREWKFFSSGILKLPLDGDIVDHNGYSVLSSTYLTEVTTPVIGTKLLVRTPNNVQQWVVLSGIPDVDPTAPINSDISYSSNSEATVIDTDGNVYIIGKYSDSSLNNINNTYRGIVKKFSPTGVLVWEKSVKYKSSTTILGESLRIGFNSNGTTNTNLYCLFDCHMTVEGGPVEIAKLVINFDTTDGSIIWQKVLGYDEQTQTDLFPGYYAKDLDVDVHGNVYVIADDWSGDGYGSILIAILYADQSSVWRYLSPDPDQPDAIFEAFQIVVQNYDPWQFTKLLIGAYGFGTIADKPDGSYLITINGPFTEGSGSLYGSFGALIPEATYISQGLIRGIAYDDTSTYVALSDRIIKFDSFKQWTDTGSWTELSWPTSCVSWKMNLSDITSTEGIGISWIKCYDNHLYVGMRYIDYIDPNDADTSTQRHNQISVAKLATKGNFPENVPVSPAIHNNNRIIPHIELGDGINGNMVDYYYNGLYNGWNLSQRSDSLPEVVWVKGIAAYSFDGTAQNTHQWFDYGWHDIDVEGDYIAIAAHTHVHQIEMLAVKLSTSSPITTNYIAKENYTNQYATKFVVSDLYSRFLVAPDTSTTYELQNVTSYFFTDPESSYISDSTLDTTFLSHPLPAFENNGIITYYNDHVYIPSDTNYYFGLDNLIYVNGVEYKPSLGTIAIPGLGIDDIKTAVGLNALTYNTTGINNVAVGSLALSANTTGENNIAVGNNALEWNTVGSCNVAVGGFASQENIYGFGNTVVGYQARRYRESDWDTAIGYAALMGNSITSNFNGGGANVAVGAYSLYLNTSGFCNIAVGNDALYFNTEGDNNIAVGTSTLYHNTTGIWNVAVGRSSMFWNTTGAANVAVGYQAGQNISTGNNNVAIGNSALIYGNGGTSNIAIGYDAGHVLNTDCIAIGRASIISGNGSNNIAIGALSQYIATTGYSNTSVGVQSLYNNTTGHHNIAIGERALYNTTGSYNIGIGGMNSAGYYVPAFDIGSQNHYISLGSTSVTNAYIQVAWTVNSDARDKTNFADCPHGLEFVSQLKPMQYQFRTSREDDTPHGGIRYGFKAQDILELEGDNPVIIDAQNPDKLYYNSDGLIPVLVNAIKDLKLEIDALKAELAIIKGN